MYREFYGLRENPFNVTSDPHFLFMSKRHKEAFSHLRYGINERKGFLVITGEIGTGKTTLCRALLNTLGGNVSTSLIINPNLSEMQMLKAILGDFGVDTLKRTKFDLFRQLNGFLLEELRQNRNVALIIDEAQNLRTTVLEQIRLLSNLETEKEKLLQIVLIGQPQLRQKLNLPQLEQLKQRIAVGYHLHPLDKDEVSEYIKHRLNVAGYEGSPIFSESAVQTVAEHSGGIPRLINILCDRALLSGFVYGMRHINHELIEKSIHDVDGHLVGVPV